MSASERCFVCESQGGRKDQERERDWNVFLARGELLLKIYVAKCDYKFASIIPSREGEHRVFVRHVGRGGTEVRRDHFVVCGA